jgi:hypothetical protein
MEADVRVVYEVQLLWSVLTENSSNTDLNHKAYLFIRRQEVESLRVSLVTQGCHERPSLFRPQNVSSFSSCLMAKVWLPLLQAEMFYMTASKTGKKMHVEKRCSSHLSLVFYWRQKMFHVSVNVFPIHWLELSYMRLGMYLSSQSPCLAMCKALGCIPSPLCTSPPRLRSHVYC